MMTKKTTQKTTRRILTGKQRVQLQRYATLYEDLLWFASDFQECLHIPDMDNAACLIALHQALHTINRCMAVLSGEQKP